MVFIVNFLVSKDQYESIKYKYDDSSDIAINEKIDRSHLKIYLPSIPYSYIMRLINGTLVRLSENKNGWEYFLAKSHKKLDPLIYEFSLREDVKFQDGSAFDADSIIENFNSFKKGAFTYTDIHNKLDFVEKVSKYKIRIHLKAPYGMLLNDLARINLYTKQYLEKNGWANNIVGANTKIPGPYGSGPYILSSGYAVGLTQSEKLVLKANPYYFEKEKPYIKTITIYTKLPIDEVIKKITEEEGKLDIAIIPFDKKTEIVNSTYAKLISVKSSANFSIHMNLMNPSSKLHNKKIRQALNQALDQAQLKKFVYKNEGTISPFPLSTNSYYAKSISKKYIKNPKIFFTQKELHELLNGLNLKVVTQDRFQSLWRGIEYQLNKYGVHLFYEITTDESYVLKKLLTNREHKYDWDLLIWGNSDWYGHPWTSFFALYTKNQWSAINKDKILDKKFEELFQINNHNSLFQQKVNDILEYIYEKSYMLAIPSPNMLLALNKEVAFCPSPVAILKLWEARLTPYHWSIRGDKKLPDSRKEYIYPQRISHDE